MDRGHDGWHRGNADHLAPVDFSLHDLVTGTSRILGVPVAQVVFTASRRAACGQWNEAGPRIISDSAVLDSDPQADPRTLALRSDRLIWKVGEAEHSAPFPNQPTPE